MNRQIWLAIAGASVLAGMTVPAQAQRKSEGFEFLEAVRDRDGAKATELLNQPGNVLVNARDIGTGETALHIATQRRDVTWMRFLFGKGAKANIEDRNGATPLEIASQLGFTEGIELLLEQGADVDATNAAGETPLISAVHRRDTAVIRLLMEKGSNPDRTDNSGRSARDYATLMGARSAALMEIEQAEADRGEQTEAYGPT